MKKIILIVLIPLFGAIVLMGGGRKDEKKPCAVELPPYTIYHSFEEYFHNVERQTSVLNIREGCSERLVRNTDGRARVSILYIHGFGASRAEGEAVLDQVADSLDANIYYLRLPGHGTTIEDHRDSTFREHLAAVRDAVLMMDLLGERIFIAGTSYGGLLATYVSALYPHRISGTILVSPLYGFANPVHGFIMSNERLLSMIESMNPVRKILNENAPDDMWRRYWYDTQYVSALKQLAVARERIVQPCIIDNVDVPVCLIYYYRNRKEQDQAASVAMMRKVFSRFSNPYNTEMRVEHGAHVLTSEFIPSDKKTVRDGMISFIEKVVMECPAPRPKDRGYSIGM